MFSKKKKDSNWSVVTMNLSWRNHSIKRANPNKIIGSIIGWKKYRPINLPQITTKKNHNLVVWNLQRNKVETSPTREGNHVKEAKVEAENWHPQTRWEIWPDKLVIVTLRTRRKEKSTKFAINCTICWQTKRKLSGSWFLLRFHNFSKKH